MKLSHKEAYRLERKVEVCAAKIEKAFDDVMRLLAKITADAEGVDEIGRRYHMCLSDQPLETLEAVARRIVGVRKGLDKLVQDLDLKDDVNKAEEHEAPDEVVAG